MADESTAQGVQESGGVGEQAEVEAHSVEIEAAPEPLPGPQYVCDIGCS